MQAIIEENNRRNMALNTHYDPTKGIGCIGKRTRVDVSHLGFGAEVWLPDTMLADEKYPVASTNADSWVKLRCHHDFEFWCVTCVKIKDKLSGQDIPFRLNAPQRRVAAIFESQRMAVSPFVPSCSKHVNGVALPSRRCIWHGYNRYIVIIGTLSSVRM